MQKKKKQNFSSQKWLQKFKNFVGGFQPLSFHSPLLRVDLELPIFVSFYFSGRGIRLFFVDDVDAFEPNFHFAFGLAICSVFVRSL